MDMLEQIMNFIKQMGFYLLGANFLNDTTVFNEVLQREVVIAAGWKSLVMILVSLLLLWLAIKKQFEPLLLIGIAFGMLLTNLPGAGMYNGDLWTEFMTKGSDYYHDYGFILANGGLLDILYIGVKTCVYPCLIFIGIGAMTDFSPLISNPKSLLLGAAAQIGIFATFVGTGLIGFTGNESASIGIIGGADGPTAIFVTTQLLEMSSNDR